VLAQRLHRLKGKFILSLDDHPKIREIFQAFPIRRTEIAYTAQRKVGGRYGELLIMNFEPRAEADLKNQARQIPVKRK
jgi:DNA adenine methylase